MLLSCTGDGTNEGDRDGGCDDCVAAACTQADQAIEGTALALSAVELNAPAGNTVLIADANQLQEAFPDGVPEPLADVDFATDRLVFGQSNPAVRFAADTGARIVVGEELFCEGVAPRGIAYIISGTTRDALHVVSCPYTGPDPCLAP